MFEANSIIFPFIQFNKTSQALKTPFTEMSRGVEKSTKSEMKHEIKIQTIDTN